MQISTTYLEKQKRLIKICLPNILTAMFLFISASLFYIVTNKLKWIIVSFVHLSYGQVAWKYLFIKCLSFQKLQSANKIFQIYHFIS